MRSVMYAAAALAVTGLAACAGMAPGGYGDMPEDGLAGGSAIPQAPQQPMPPTPMTLPSGQPRPGAVPQVIIPPPPPPLRTGGPAQTPPPSAAVPPASNGGCSAPNIRLRTEVPGAVEIKCGPPPAPAPAGKTCAAPLQLTYYTRNGTSSYECMR